LPIAASALACSVPSFVMEAEVSKLSRILFIAIAGVLVCPATVSAETGCHKRLNRHTHKWATHCLRGAPPVVVPAEPVVVVPPPGPITNTDPTDRYWYDPED
jgi:hypothetical protein